MAVDVTSTCRERCDDAGMTPITAVLNQTGMVLR
jgi:hypothetical protein